MATYLRHFVRVGVYADSKSGQTFWRSTDGTLIVKTIKRYECQNLRNMIDSYAQHVQGDHSCLSGVLGVYRIRLKKQGRRFRYFLVTRSVFSKSVGPSVPDRGYVPQYLTAPYTESNTNGMRFDLKGSTYGRRKSASSNVLKDLDLLNLPSGFETCITSLMSFQWLLFITLPILFVFSFLHKHYILDLLVCFFCCFRFLPFFSSQPLSVSSDSRSPS